MRPRNQRLLIALLVVLSLATATLPRWALSHTGLPYEHHWDEPTILNRAVTMAKSGDFNPYFFNYGSLSIYLSAITVSATYLHSNTLPTDHPDAISSLRELQTGKALYPWFISHPRFLLTARWITVFFGVAGCMLLLGLGFLFQRPAVGAVAALLLGSSQNHLVGSAFLTTDIPASTCALFALAIGAAVLHQKNTTIAPWLLAGVFCGLATSFKYNSAGIAPVVVVAILSSQLPAAKKALAAFGFAASMLFAFFAGTPYAILALPSFLRDAGFELRHYAVTGHENANIAPGFPHLMADLGLLSKDFGALATAFGIVGIPFLLRRVRGSWVLLAGALVQLMLTASTMVSFHRNVALVYPIFALCSGAGIVWMVRKLRPADSRLGLAIVATVFALMVIPRVTLVRDEINRGFRPDSRTQAIDRLNDATFSSQGPVLLAKELRFHPSDLARLDHSFSIAPMLEILCRRVSPEAIRVLPLRLASTKEEDETRIASLNKLFEGLRPSAVGRVGAAPTFLDKFSVSPAIGAWRGGSPLVSDLLCTDLSPLKLSIAEEHKVPGGAPFMLAPGEVLEGHQRGLEPGHYVLGWCHQSTGEAASKVLLKINGAGLNIERSLPTPVKFCRQARHHFTVTSKGSVHFSIEPLGENAYPVRISPPRLNQSEKPPSEASTQSQPPA